MLVELLQKLFSRSSPQSRRVETQKSRPEPTTFKDKYREENVFEFEILDGGVALETAYACCDLIRNRKSKPGTKLFVQYPESNQKEWLEFLGVIPDSSFPQLRGQRAKLTVLDEAHYNWGTGAASFKWRCTQDQALEVLTGELTGQKFTGREGWDCFDDDFPPVILRAVRAQLQSN
ncbi:MAG: hypothetical protein WAN50_01630 [Minisyncoccia bacterium]